MGEKTAEIVANHDAFALVVAAALGGGENDAPPPKVGQAGVKDLGAGHASVEDAVAAINKGMMF